MRSLFTETYRYRELIWALALKELRVRYKRSFLGFIWALLNPALLMLVLTVVFGTIMKFTVPHYSIFLLSVLLPWTFFSQALAYSVESIVGNGELLKKVRVAKLVFPVAALPAAFVDCAGARLAGDGGCRRGSRPDRDVRLADVRDRAAG